MQNFNTNKWNEQQKRNEAFRAAMANGGVYDPAGYQPSQLSASGRVPLAVGAPGLMPTVDQGPWGDAKYTPMTPMRAPEIVKPVVDPNTSQSDGRAPAPTNPAPLVPSAPQAPAGPPMDRPTASPPPMDRPTGGPLKREDKKQATQANRNANGAFRSYMQMFNRKGS